MSSVTSLADARGGLLLSLLRLARPRDWAKAVFVLLPVPFAMVAGAEIEPLRFALGVFAFCLTASAAYALNDVRDADADRAHPRKRRRPVASGAVSVPLAVGLSAALAASGLALGWATGGTLLVVLLLVYLAQNLAYSFGAKNVPLVDVFLLSSGFLLRVLAGCALLAVAPSSWLLTCTIWVALFLGFGKRRADLAAGMGVAQRKALGGYTKGFLDHAMSISCGVALLSYTLYSQEARVFLAGRELAGMPFVAFGLLHYLRLALVEEVVASPVELAYRSRTLQLCSLGYAVATLWSLGAV